jgi:transcriptional regulator with XRE-family HTH domain
MESLYKKIKHLRENANYTQRYMAEELGVDCATYSRIENGKIDITVSRLLKLAQILSIHPESLLTENSDKKIQKDETNAEIIFHVKISTDNKNDLSVMPLIKEIRVPVRER